MKNYYLFLFTIIHLSGNAQWEQVGANMGYTNSPVPSLAFDPITADPYIAYASSGYIIEKFDGSVWTQVGTNLGFSSSSAGISLAFDPVSNLPYVAFNNNIFNQFETFSFNSTNWVQTGIFNGANYISEIDLVFDPITNEIYMAYSLIGAVWDELKVVKFSSGSWSYVGSTLVSTQSTGRPSIVFNPLTNEPYVAYSRDGSSIEVKRFDGVNWIGIGPISGTPGNFGNISLAFDSTNYEPYIAFVNRANNMDKYEIQKFDGSNWVQVGSNPGSSTGTGSINIIFNPSTNEPYVAYPDDVLNNFIVQKFDGINWTQVGVGLGVPTIGGECAIAFNPLTFEPVVGYFDTNLNSLIVQKYIEENLSNESTNSLNENCFLFPNPSERDINLVFNKPFESININVLDFLGKLIYSKKSENIIGPLNLNLNLTTGVYFIEIISNEERMVKRFIIN